MHVMDLSWDGERYIMVSEILVQTSGLYGPRTNVNLGKFVVTIFFM
jgi:hypothetical protein